jgi:three-Cys-motif partner protein
MPEETLWKLDDHTRAKHHVLRGYLEAWLPVMGQQALKFKAMGDPRLLVVDGFAGPGRYATGEEGSPLIMLRTLLEHDAFDRMADVKFLFLFIEHSDERVEHLEGEIEALDLPGNIEVAVENGEFEDVFGELVEGVHAKKNRELVPTFAFIDPFGYTQAPMALSDRFLAFSRCEALVFLPLTHINRFVTRDKQEDGLNALFGSERWREAADLSGRERMEFLLALFEDQLRSQGRVQYVRSFELRTKDGNDYRLVFATQHRKGLELIKDAMWGVDPLEGARYVAARTQEGQEILFTSDGSAIDTSPLLDHFNATFGGEWFSIEQAEEATLDTPYRVAHIKRKTLGPAEKAGRVEVDRSGGQRQFAAGVRVRFKD